VVLLAVSYQTFLCNTLLLLAVVVEQTLIAVTPVLVGLAVVVAAIAQVLVENLVVVAVQPKHL
jgi:hypothetical protein